MAYEKVKRNRYFTTSPGDLHKHDCLNHHQDMQEFHRPLERMHNANLHDWGIARGLEVSGEIGGTEVVIQPGVALNAQGELIALRLSAPPAPPAFIEDKAADIGADPAGGNNQEVTVPVHFALGSQAGKTVYVTIQFSEILRGEEGSGGRMEQVPWIRLQPVPDPGAPVSDPGAYVDDGVSVILAIAEIGADGKLKDLKAEDSTPGYGRRVIGQSLEELRIQRSIKVGNQIQETISGKIEPGDGGGLKITVPNGNTALVAIGASGNAGDLSVKDGSGKDLLHVFETHGAGGRVDIGDSTSSSGALFVKDGTGRDTFSVYGSSASVAIGAKGNEGTLSVKDGEGRDVFKVDGNAASVEIGARGHAGDLLLVGDLWVGDGKGRDIFRVFKHQGAGGAFVAGGRVDICDSSLFVKDEVGRDIFAVYASSASVAIGAKGNAADLSVKDGEGREVFKVDGNASNAASVAIGASGNAGELSLKTSSGASTIKLEGQDGKLILGGEGNKDGDLFIKNGAGDDTFNVDGSEGDIFVRRRYGTDLPEVMKFDASDAALYLGSKGNEGDLIVIDNAGSESARITGDTGTLNIKRIDPYGDVLDIDAQYLRIHGRDLCLDGRSGGNKRALVDDNNRLVINFANDYASGVKTPGNFSVVGTLTVGEEQRERIIAGNPARYVKTCTISANNGYGTEEVVFDHTTQVFAFLTIVAVDVTHGFSLDPMRESYYADVIVDKRQYNSWWYYQGPAQRILFRVHSGQQEVNVWAVGIVFYE